MQLTGRQAAPKPQPLLVESNHPSSAPCLSAWPPLLWLAFALREAGESLNVRQIKARLIELGFGDKFKTQPNYHYSLVYRLSKSSKLLKRGSKYRAPPASSP